MFFVYFFNDYFSKMYSMTNQWKMPYPRYIVYFFPYFGGSRGVLRVTPTHPPPTPFEKILWSIQKKNNNKNEKRYENWDKHSYIILFYFHVNALYDVNNHIIFQKFSTEHPKFCLRFNWAIPKHDQSNEVLLAGFFP